MRMIWEFSIGTDDWMYLDWRESRRSVILLSWNSSLDRKQIKMSFSYDSLFLLLQPQVTEAGVPLSTWLKYAKGELKAKEDDPMKDFYPSKMEEYRSVYSQKIIVIGRSWSLGSCLDCTMLWIAWNSWMRIPNMFMAIWTRTVFLSLRYRVVIKQKCHRMEPGKLLVLMFCMNLYPMEILQLILRIYSVLSVRKEIGAILTSRSVTTFVQSLKIVIFHWLANVTAVLSMFTPLVGILLITHVVNNVVWWKLCFLPWLILPSSILRFISARVLLSPDHSLRNCCPRHS